MERVPPKQFRSRKKAPAQPIDGASGAKASTNDDPALAELAHAINAAHAAALAGFRNGMEHAIKTGTLLHQAKKLVGHGGWEKWVKANCKFSKSSAELYMTIAKRLEIMPELKEAVLDKTINAANFVLKQQYDEYMRRRQLNRETLAHAFFTHVESAKAVLEQIKAEMNTDCKGEDIGWNSWLAGLDDEDKASVHCYMNAKPVALPKAFNRWENPRQDPDKVTSW